MDQHWLTLIKERKFAKENTLEDFQQVLETINISKFPLHQRRVTLLEAKQKGDPLEFIRELIELARAAEWATFSEESAICHLFLNNVKCDEAKKLCFEILRKNLASEDMDRPLFTGINNNIHNSLYNNLCKSLYNSIQNSLYNTIHNNMII